MNKVLILVVEDDKPVRNLITTTLKMHDYRFIEASCAEMALLETARSIGGPYPHFRAYFCNQNRTRARTSIVLRH